MSHHSPAAKRPFLTHIALHVKDINKSIAFYQEYCGLKVVHDRFNTERSAKIVWLAEEGREKQFIIVLIPGGSGNQFVEHEYSHLGFAVHEKKTVDEIAERAKKAGYLIWPPTQETYPVGYYCGVRDPDGNAVEFSYGQPLGPGTGIKR